jgi:mannose-6-phosphate isomerase-like protein (cupin superfamily)
VQVIHFTEGATDKLWGSLGRGARFVTLLEATGDVHVTCLHLSPGAHISDPSVTHDRAALVVYGKVAIHGGEPERRVDLHAGEGVIIPAGQRFSIDSAGKAIVLTVEAQWVEPALAGLSTPARIEGQSWPGEEE